MRIQEAFAVVLRRTRLGADLTQTDLALRTGLTSRYIKKLEAGTSCPTLDVVFKLSSALDVEPSLLVAAVAAEAN